MKKIILLLLFTFSSLFIKATHIAGADLTYEWIAGNNYNVTFTFYRDCSGVPAPTAPVIHFVSSSCNQNFTVTLLPVSGTGQEITTVCPSQATTCTVGSLYGIQEFVYKNTYPITLQPCSDWVIYYCVCCRNPPISTIPSPNSNGMFIMATLNNTAATISGTYNPNSSPVFSNKPNTIICFNQQFCYNHGALDVDGDSLVYSLIAPYDEGPSPYSSSCTGYSGSTVNYLSPWSAQQPLSSNPPVSIDPITGDICMNPTQLLVTVMAVRVEEWRRISPNPPVLVGSVIRDMQVSVIPCTNNLPTLAGIDTTATVYDPNDTIYTWNMCLGDTLNFDVFSHDSDATNNLTISWNSGIPTASWNVTGNSTPNATGHFYWIPNASDVSNVPHCFTAQVSDDACPYLGTQTFSYCITVKGMYADIGNDTLLCKGEIDTIHAHVDTSAVNIQWSVNGNPVPTLNDTTFIFNSNLYASGSYTIMIIADDGSTLICPGVDHININVVNTPNVNLGSNIIACNGQSIPLDAGSGQIYYWSPFGQTTQIIDVVSSGIYSVTVDGGNNTRCKDNDSITVTFYPIPSVDLGPDTCVASGIVIDAENTGLGFTYLWSNGENTQTINAQTTGTYIVTVVYPASPCIDIDTVQVSVIPYPIFDLGQDTTICSHQHVTLTGPINTQYTYLWLPGGETTPYIVTSSEGTHILQVTGCKVVTDTIDIIVKPCDLTVPNVITPNNDTHNDNFVVKNLEYYPNSKLTIFNRWGNKIYESTDYKNDWNGEGHSDGVYYFILIANDGSAKGIEYHGTITIIGSKN